MIDTFRWIDFKSISDFSIEGEIIGIHIEKDGIMGLRKKTITFQHAIIIEKTSDPISQVMLADHYFDYVLELPGKINKAYPLHLEGVYIEPSIEEKVITWSIPFVNDN